MNESGTADDFANLVKNPYFRSLENDYVKLVKKLEKIEGVEQEVDLNALPTEERNGFLQLLIGEGFGSTNQRSEKAKKVCLILTPVNLILTNLSLIYVKNHKLGTKMEKKFLLSYPYLFLHKSYCHVIKQTTM